MSVERLVDPEYVELCIIKTLLSDKRYLIMLSSVFESDYFDAPEAQTIFKVVNSHFKKYKEIPEESMILSHIDADKKDSLSNYFREIGSTDISIVKNYDWIMSQTDLFLKDKAIKDAIRRSVDIIDKGEDAGEIRKLVESALCKNLTVDLGLSYFDELGDRLKRMFNDENQRLRSYFPELDEYINGGFPPKTLSVMISKVHGFKCLCYNTLINTDVDGNIKIGDFFEKNINTYNEVFKLSKESTMSSLKGVKKIDLFIKKYGEEEGVIRYDEYVKRCSFMKSRDGYIEKYGEDEGNSRYDRNMEKNKRKGKMPKGCNTLQYNIEKYGEDEGNRRYNEKTLKLKTSNKGINTLDYYIDKYGEEGERLYLEKNGKISDKGRCTLLYFIERYGEEEGYKSYEQYMTRQRFSHTLEGMIQKHGEEKGEQMWERKKIPTFSLVKCIENYGEVEGKKVFQERQEKWLKSYKKVNYSKVSQKLFWAIYNKLDNIDNIFFAQLDKNKQLDDTGRNYEYRLKVGNTFVKPDFICTNRLKVIEFDGDYWHGNGRGNKISDHTRDVLITEAGYEVLHIKERDWKIKPDKEIQKCLEFING